jgi:hypothetical protein
VEESGYKKYKKLVDEEMSTSERVDSLFFDFYFGMTSKQFYAECWKKNKQEIFTDDASNTAVQYKTKTELKYPASMNFYPGFKQGKISKMGVSFQYDGWAPWNKHLSSDSLQQDVLRLFKAWYPKGNPFITVDDGKRGPLYIKVDKNRRIIIGRYDDAYVKVDYTDLTLEKGEIK